MSENESAVARAIGARETGEGDVSQVKRERDELLTLTHDMDKHPDGYKGICECRACLGYVYGSGPDPDSDNDSTGDGILRGGEG